MQKNSSKSRPEENLSVENLSVTTPSGKILTVTRRFGADGKVETTGDAVLIPALDSVAALADKYGEAELIPDDEFERAIEPTICTITMLEKENDGKTTLH